jgi:hypothetical protein
MAKRTKNEGGTAVATASGTATVEGEEVVTGTTDGPPAADEAVAADEAGRRTESAIAATGEGDQERGTAEKAAAQADEAFEDRPEIFVGAAFLAGFVLAKVIGALGGDD